MKPVIYSNLVLLVFSLALLGVQRGLPPEGETIQLAVNPLQQLKITSCGPAVLAMALNHAFPQEKVSERDILTYAEMQGWYTETKYPYTSPENMVNLARHYAKNISTGHATHDQDGLEILFRQLRRGNPIMVDALTLLDDPRSGAHFVLVTGLSVSPDNKYAVTVTYIDPLTGQAKSAPYYGEGGLWDAWRRNGDPGGAGWWLVIPLPFNLKTPMRLGENLAL